MVSFLISIIGFLHVSRIMKMFLNEKKFSYSFLMKTFTALIFVTVVFCFLTVWFDDFIVLILQILMILIFYFIEPVLNLILRHKFYAKLLIFFDEVLLMMTTGRSFRDSLLTICKLNNDFYSNKILEIYTTVQTRHQNKSKIKSIEPDQHKEFNTLLLFFLSIEDQPNKVMEKVKNFRRQLYWKLNFQKKSSQASSQVKVQAFVLCILYSGLCVFSWSNSSATFLKWFLISMILFLTGLLSLYILSRRKSWKT